MSCLRHRHEFSRLWATFGPFGNQEVHYHVCINGDGDCSRVVMGDGRQCDPSAKHWRTTLSDDGEDRSVTPDPEAPDA